MTAVRVAIGFGPGPGGWTEALTFAREAERLGVDSAWTSEAWGFDAVTPLALLAGQTARLRLGTGIMQAGTRTPALVAMTALTLASISGGRFILGLGSSGPQVMEGWHGVPFDRPLQRLRETVAIVRAACRGERLDFAGDIYRLPLPGGEGRALRTSAPPAEVPIYLATLGPRALEVTGEIADGWIASSFMPSRARPFFEAIRRGAARAGRALDGFETVAGGVVQFGDDLQRLTAPRKPGFAFEIGAMGSRQRNFYKDAYARQGYADLVERVQALWLERRRDEAAALIPDEFVLEANLLGTPAMVRDRIRAYRDAGVTTIQVAPAGETLAERLDTLGRFMDLVADVNREPASAAES
ncbi:LLM class flavin-dependent oxidoreductase [Tepidiforma flava]|uniref:LLM class flavin-dependent oxidoreductase n=1 Tax=Tepidiforma flava TaxID=3004094 RepID=A0ABY7M9M7_9CHLR|nr:LLM class flavin-dependent oxidoreductase [Tepidiforma flava]WBL37125.1 LLM class flavin-dependent oxidoreductase [Tepidiforma flava]